MLEQAVQIWLLFVCHKVSSLEMSCPSSEYLYSQLEKQRTVMNTHEDSAEQGVGCAIKPTATDTSLRLSEMCQLVGKEYNKSLLTLAFDMMFRKMQSGWKC